MGLFKLQRLSLFRFRLIKLDSIRKDYLMLIREWDFYILFLIKLLNNKHPLKRELLMLNSINFINHKIHQGQIGGYLQIINNIL
jgi:hypothetical protein